MDAVRKSEGLADDGTASPFDPIYQNPSPRLDCPVIDANVVYQAGEETVRNKILASTNIQTASAGFQIILCGNEDPSTEFELFIGGRHELLGNRRLGSGR